MRRKLNRPQVRGTNKIKKCVEASYTQLCAHLLTPSSELKKIRPVVQFARWLSIKPLDAVILIFIIADKGKIHMSKLKELTRPLMSADELTSVLYRLRSMLYLKSHDNMRHGETVQLHMEFMKAIDSGDLGRILELRPCGSEGILAYVARIARQAPFEPTEWEHFLNYLWTAQDSDHEFLAYIDDLEIFESLQESFMLLVAMNHYYYDKPTSLRNLKEVVRYSESDIRELSIEIVRGEWRPIAQGFVEVADAGGVLFSAPGLKLTSLGIETFFPDLDFDTLEGEVGTTPFRPFVGTYKDLRFSKELTSQLSPIQELFTPGVYERYVQESTLHHKGLLVLLHGCPGSGKTAFCENLLARSKRPMLAIQSTIMSKWVGESAQQISKVFERYHAFVRQHKTYPVILLNEADSVLGKRTDISSSTDTEFNSINGRLLEELEALLNRGGLVLATTNTLSHLDEAFYRRFTDIIEFKGLSSEEQVGLWKGLLPELSMNEAEFLFEQLGPIQPGNIQNIVAQICRSRFLEPNQGTTLSVALELGLRYRKQHAA